MKLMNKVSQVVQISGKAVITDVRHVYLRKGQGIFGTVEHEGRKVKVHALGNQCWEEVA